MSSTLILYVVALVFLIILGLSRNSEVATCR